MGKVNLPVGEHILLWGKWSLLCDNLFYCGGNLIFLLRKSTFLWGTSSSSWENKHFHLGTNLSVREPLFLWMNTSYYAGNACSVGECLFLWAKRTFLWGNHSSFGENSCSCGICTSLCTNLSCFGGKASSCVKKYLPLGETPSCEETYLLTGEHNFHLGMGSSYDETHLLKGKTQLPIQEAHLSLWKQVTLGEMHLPVKEHIFMWVKFTFLLGNLCSCGATWSSCWENNLLMGKCNILLGKKPLLLGELNLPIGKHTFPMESYWFVRTLSPLIKHIFLRGKCLFLWGKACSCRRNAPSYVQMHFHVREPVFLPGNSSSYGEKCTFLWEENASSGGGKYLPVRKTQFPVQESFLLCLKVTFLCRKEGFLSRNMLSLWEYFVSGNAASCEGPFIH